MAAVLLGSAVYALVAVVALLTGLVGRQPAGPYAVAKAAAALCVGSLVLAALALVVPHDREGDAAADILIWLWLAAFVAGLVLLVFTRTRKRPHQGM